MLLCCRSHSKFLRRDSVSSVESMLRRVDRGDSASWLCVLDVVMMIGRAAVPCCAAPKPVPDSGEVATDGPLGVAVRDRRIAGVDRDAAFASAFARSGSCIKVVKSERRDVRFGRESTRWNRSFSLTDECALISSESSQSDESSSSSIALSDTSSSSSSDSNTGLCSAARPIAISFLKDVCFLLLDPPRGPAGRFKLSDSALLNMWLSSELSSSPDDVPMVNIGPFFFGCAACLWGTVLRIGVGCAARLVCDRYDDGAPPGTNPRIMLCVLISVFELPSELKLCEAFSSSFVSTVDADDSRKLFCDSVTEGGWAVESDNCSLLSCESSMMGVNSCGGDEAELSGIGGMAGVEMGRSMGFCSRALLC